MALSTADPDHHRRVGDGRCGRMGESALFPRAVDDCANLGRHDPGRFAACELERDPGTARCWSAAWRQRRSGHWVAHGLVPAPVYLP